MNRACRVGLQVVCITFVVSLAVPPLEAALIAYEPFDYPEGIPLVGRTNGFGFKAPWVAGGFNARFSRFFRIAAGPITYPGLATKGTSHVSGEGVSGPGIAGVGRLLSTNLGTTNATYYLSFLYRLDGDTEYASVVVGVGKGAELAIGKSAGQYCIENRGGRGRVLTGIVPVVGQTRFFVVKMEFLEGPDRFTLYIDPTPGKDEPTAGFVKEDLDLQYADMIFLYSRAAWSVGEIRLGTTWADVTPTTKTALAK